MVVGLVGPDEHVGDPRLDAASGADLDVRMKERLEPLGIPFVDGGDHRRRELAAVGAGHCPGGGGTGIVTPSSRNWRSSTGAGAPVSGSPPEAVFGNAITSRIDSVPAASAQIRSMP